jgi:hypothetical protein
MGDELFWPTVFCMIASFKKASAWDMAPTSLVFARGSPAPSRTEVDPKIGPRVKVCDHGGCGLGRYARTQIQTMKNNRKQHHSPSLQQIVKKVGIHPW